MRHRTGMLAGLAAGVGLAAGFVISAQGQDDGVIRACADHHGVLRLADTGCGKKERSVRWGMSGPAGPQGPKGDTGATGATGAPGPLLTEYPPGQLVRGVFTIDPSRPESLALSNGSRWSRQTAVSFALPLRVPLAAGQMNVIPLNPLVPADGCPGSISDPQAAPGHLCIYANTRISAPAGSVDPQPEVRIGGAGTGRPAVERWGFRLTGVWSCNRLLGGMCEGTPPVITGTWALTTP